MRDRLRGLVDEMHRSTLYWVKATYRKNPPVMAQDANPATQLKLAINALTRRWSNRFDDAAKDLAKYFSTKMALRSDANLRAILKRGGFSIQFKMTKAMRDVLNATIEEQVGLIRSIPQQYLGAVQGAVMRSVQAGGDLESLNRFINDRYYVTKKRAALISRDQNNKSTANFIRVRQVELGIEQAVWLHSHAGKKPRKTHLANDGKRYDPAKGWFDPDPRVKRHVWPGELINCFPGDMPVGLETHPIRLWRAPFKGPVVHIGVGTNLLKGTFNHPVLTARGWVRLGEINGSDYIVCMRRDGGEMVDHDEHHNVSTFKKLFEASAVVGVQRRRSRECCNFYGDVPNDDVDEVVVVNDYLPAKWDASGVQHGGDVVFAETDAVRCLQFLGGDDQVSNSLLSGSRSDGAPLLARCRFEANDVGAASAPHYALTHQDVSDVGCGVARYSEFDGDGCRSHAALVERDDLTAERVPIAPAIDFESDKTEFFAEFVRVAADSGRRVFEFGALLYEFRRVRDKRIVDFSGHVFSMETMTGYYSVGDAFVQAKNCRCVSKSVVKGLS